MRYLIILLLLTFSAGSAWFHSYATEMEWRDVSGVYVGYRISAQVGMQRYQWWGNPQVVFDDIKLRREKP